MVPDDTDETTADHEEAQSPAWLLDRRWPFGAMFFLRQLGSFARDRCPDPAEGLPVVHLHLADGEILDICHIIGVAPTWLVLAVNEFEGTSGGPTMRTEFIPYAMVQRVTIRPGHVGGHRVGFDLGRRADLVPSPTASKIMTPEEAVALAAGQAAQAMTDTEPTGAGG